MRWPLQTVAFSISIAASLLITSAGAEDSLARIRQLLAQNSVTCANFEQQKSMRALSRPLVSRGELRFVAGAGILWQVQEPIALRILIKNDSLIRWDDEDVPHHLGVGQTPIFRALSEVFAAAFSGDMEDLRDTFEATQEINDSNWRLTLTPRDKKFSAIISTIRLAGSRFVEELVIEEEGGDETLIRFSDMTVKSCELSSAEKGYFAH